MTAPAPSEQLYKVLNADRSCHHGGNGSWPVDEWQTVQGKLVPCRHGLHVLTRVQVLLWLGPVIAPVELAPDARRIDAFDKTVVSRARAGEALPTWNARTQRLFAADCAEHVLHLFEAKFPDDPRPREAIAVARRFARGEATQAELTNAYASAYASAYAATAASAATAAYASAYASAYAATAASATTAAYAYAATTAAYAYAATEREWQTEQLWQYLDGVLT